MIPQDLLFAETHEWVRIGTEGGRKLATIPIPHFAIEPLPDLVDMILKPVGTRLKAGTQFGEVESVKAVSDLYSPVAGEIIAVNSDLSKRLESLGKDAYNSGWMIKVALSDETSLS